MNKMKTSDSAGFIYADCGCKDLGPCDLNEALKHFDDSPWQSEVQEMEKLFDKQQTPCWPDLTFRIGKYHIAIMLKSSSENFEVEVCMPPVKKTLGLFKVTKFFL